MFYIYYITLDYITLYNTGPFAGARGDTGGRRGERGGGQGEGGTGGGSGRRGGGLASVAGSDTRHPKPTILHLFYRQVKRLLNRCRIVAVQ